MFNLDQAIARWRGQMLDAGIKSPAPLDELESHLRDDIAGQMRSGLSAQQAFEAAIQHIGDASVLKAEFERADETRRARELKLLGAVTIGSACFYGLFVGTCVGFKLGSLSDLDFREQLSALAAGALTILLLLSGHMAHWFFPVIRHRRTRVGIVLGGVAVFLGWLSIYYYLVMTRFELDMSQFLVSFLWALAPWGALLGFIYGMEYAALHKGGVRA